MAPKERIPFTLDEILPAWFEYLNSYQLDGSSSVYDRKVASEGMASHRKDPVASAMCIHGQIAYYDTKNNVIKKHFDRCGKLVKGLMAEYNDQHQVERFAVWYCWGLLLLVTPKVPL